MFVFKPVGLHNCVLMRLWVYVCVCVCVCLCVSNQNRYLALGDAYQYNFVSYILFIKTNKQLIWLLISAKKCSCSCLNLAAEKSIIQ